MNAILVLNAGSSTLKYALFESETLRTVAAETISLSYDPRVYQDAARQILDTLDKDPDLPNVADIQAVGHRVVHGSTEFQQPVVIDDRVLDTIQNLSYLAPLHNPPAVAAIHAAQEALPDVPHAAVFDTAFFADLSPKAHIYPVPYEWYTDYGIRRFGFHGISHAYCTHRAAELLGRPAEDLRLVTCHLGHGCSASAIKDGKPIATTMGFTPLEGLMMGTRSGSIDPGILLHLLDKNKVSVEDLDQALNRESGLLGVSGLSSDFQEVEEAANAGNTRAQLAIDMFADRVRATIGALTVTLGGIDGLVFTAGIGEHSVELREQVCEGLQSVGCILDLDRNRGSKADAEISAAHSVARILLIRSREDLQIAHDVRRLLESS